MRQYKIGFSLGELLICLGLMAVIAAMIIPAATKHVPSKNKALFKKSYHNIEKITFDLINNTTIFPDATIESYNDNADLSTGFAYFNPEKGREKDDTGKYFCKRFTEELNTSGEVLCEEAHFMPAEGVDFNPVPTKGDTSTPSFVTTDGIAWFYSPVKLCALENGVSRPNDITCQDKTNATEGVSIPLAADTYNDYVCFQIDVNGEKEPNRRTETTDPDRFNVCIYYDGSVVLPKLTGNGSEAEYLRSNTISK